MEDSKPQQSLPAYWAVIPAVVRYDNQLRPNAKLLYGEISALAQAGGYCYATNRYFAELYGFNIKTVGSLIGSLAQAGYITVEVIRGEKGQVEMRKIWITGPMSLPRTPPPQKADTPPSNNGDPPPQKAEDNTSSSNTYPPIAPREIIDQLINYAGDDAGLRDAIMEFAEMRKRLRAPIATTKTVDRLLKRIDTLSNGNRSVKIAMLQESTDKSWKTVYAPKSDAAPAKAQRREEDDPEW